MKNLWNSVIILVMKIALITDQHFGARNDSTIFLDFYQKFYEETFFPRIKKENVSAVLILGDTFDRRKYLNFYTLKRAKEMFFDPLENMGVQVFRSEEHTSELQSH